MRSLRSYARYVGVRGDSFSLMGPVLGYFHAFPTGTVSLAEQLDRVAGPHLHLTFWRIGYDRFTASRHQRMADCLATARRLLGRAGIGIGRVHWRQVAAEEAGDFMVIDSKVEAVGLRWRLEGDGGTVDVFWTRLEFGDNVRGITGPDGVVMDSDRGRLDTLAHELGHALGLWDIPVDTALYPDNVMRSGRSGPVGRFEDFQSREMLECDLLHPGWTG